MSILINVNCSNCGLAFELEKKRYNESLKRNWKFYCSSSCRSSNKKTGIYITCANTLCGKKFYRQFKKINLHTNYCSNSCAATINNKCSIRNKLGINGKTLSKYIYRSNLKYCSRPFCYNSIKYNRKYCSNKCQLVHQSKPILEYKSSIVFGIQEFVLKHGRIPVKREAPYLYWKALKVFGRWNRAIEAAGYTSNPVLFANKHTALDGHKCDSFAEMIIDNWLFERGIEHSINVPYPGNNKYTVDFKVGDYWIEYFGLLNGVVKYKKSFEMKIKLSKKHKINLIKIYPSDLFPVCKLDILVEPVIMYYSKSLVAV